MSQSPGPATLAIHGPPRRSADWSPVSTPIYQTSTFRNPAGSTDEVLYTRYGNNPNQVEVARRYAAMEGTERAIFLASGMAATVLAHLAVLRPGDHLLASRWIYGGTRVLFDQEFSRHGIEITYIDPDQPREWRRNIRSNTRAIFVEALTNPLMRVVDVPYLASLTKDRGLALLVDSTFTTPLLFRAVEHGADIVITSATKYINGHSDVIAGAVAGSAPVIEEVTRLMKLWGPSIDPHAAWLIERGMTTMPLRVERANANARAVAEWAVTRPEFSAVHWPGLIDHPDHQLATTLLSGGYGAVIGVVFRDGATAVERCCSKLRVWSHAPSLGGVESLVSEPRLTSHKGVDPAERTASGVPDGFLRLSCGCEDATDLIADLEQALT